MAKKLSELYVYHIYSDTDFNLAHAENNNSMKVGSRLNVKRSLESKRRLITATNFESNKGVYVLVSTVYNPERIYRSVYICITYEKPTFLPHLSRKW